MVFYVKTLKILRSTESSTPDFAGFFKPATPGLGKMINHKNQVLQYP